LLVGSTYTAGRRVGLAVYSIKDQKYERIADFGGESAWLNDNRRLIVVVEDRLFLLDTQTKKSHEIFSFAPDTISGLDVSRDNRLVYTGLSSVESDIWVLSLE
jgi:hypothetical protein